MSIIILQVFFQNSGRRCVPNAQLYLILSFMFQPFWPTGSGCARGFLSSMDACWAVRNWGSGQMNPLEVLAERESIYRILGQTTPENLNRDFSSYTLDPHTRYPNLNTRAVLPVQVKNLYSTDEPANVETCLKAPSNSSHLEQPKKRRRKGTSCIFFTGTATFLLFISKILSNEAGEYTGTLVQN